MFVKGAGRGRGGRRRDGSWEGRGREGAEEGLRDIVQLSNDSFCRDGRVWHPMMGEQLYFVGRCPFKGLPSAVYRTARSRSFFFFFFFFFVFYLSHHYFVREHPSVFTVFKFGQPGNPLAAMWSLSYHGRNQDEGPEGRAVSPRRCVASEREKVDHDGMLLPPWPLATQREGGVTRVMVCTGL